VDKAQAALHLHRIPKVVYDAKLYTPRGNVIKLSGLLPPFSKEGILNLRALTLRGLHCH